MFKNPVFRRVLLIVVALVVAAYGTMQLKAFLESQTPLEQVLVAKNDILPYSVITADDLGHMSLPVGSRMEGAIQDSTQVIGKLAAATIYRGEQILPQKLSVSPLVLNSEERAVGIPVDLVRSIGMTVKAGDRVDVYWLPEETLGLPEREGEVNLQPAQLVAQDATVLTVVTRESNVTPEERRQSTISNSDAVVVLKVKESEAQPVVTAIGNGLVYLVKRR